MSDVNTREICRVSREGTMSDDGDDRVTIIKKGSN